MTTATQDVSARRDELEEILQTAQQDERKLPELQRSAETQAGTSEAELVALTTSDPDSFDSVGNPKAKTQGAKLAAQVNCLRNPAAPWAGRQAAAADRTRLARNELNRHIAEHHVELAKALEPQARQLVSAVEDALRDAIAALDGLVAIQGAFTRLFVPVGGLDGSDLPSSDPISEVRRTLTRALDAGIRAPLPRSLFPEGDNPPRILNKDRSGYIGLENASDEELAAAGLGVTA